MHPLNWIVVAALNIIWIKSSMIVSRN